MTQRKPMSRKALINKINRILPKAQAAETEYYSGSEGGIWLCGSEDYHTDGIPFFDYWTFDEVHGISVHPKLRKIVESAGWHCEPYNSGVLCIWN